eukprot:3074075-Pyramimonas_sp.AAC.1
MAIPQSSVLSCRTATQGNGKQDEPIMARNFCHLATQGLDGARGYNHGVLRHSTRSSPVGRTRIIPFPRR